MNILQKIFKEHYEEIEYILHPRPIVMENIEKMINCGDPSFGGAMYGCPHCGELKFVPFRCHSKFCPTCGNKYCIDRSTKMSFKLIDCTHRHLVFTIDEELRPFFLNDRSLLDCLFQSVRSVILRMFHSLNKSRNFVPGFICVLHTFGRPLEWNPHIHCLLTEGGFSDDGFWRVVNHFNYTYLRKAFQTALLNELEKRIGPSFKKTVPVMDFISLLIQHIPEKHLTRYYGLYARHRKSDEKLRRAVPKSKHRILMDFNKWRQLFLLSFGYDPLQCPKCNHKMEFLELYHKHKPVSLEELYERAMAKYHCRSSGKCA